jgi:MFS family permease
MSTPPPSSSSSESNHYFNHNVRLAITWTILENISSSIRSGDALSAYVFLLTSSSSSAVGYVQGANGIAQLLTAFLAGYAADTFRRDRCLKVGALLGLVAAGVMVWALCPSLSPSPSPSLSSSVEELPKIWKIAVAMMAFGIYTSSYNAALESLFADSVVAGVGNVMVYTTRYALQVASAGVGPLLSLLLFLKLGNTWTLSACREVLFGGLLLMLPGLCLMLFFDDDKALGSDSEALFHRHRHHSQATTGDGKENSDDAEEEEENGEADAATTVLLTRPQVLLSSNEDSRALDFLGISTPLFVTLSILFADILSALASGMTIKFFSLFFIEKSRFGPVAISALSTISPFGIATLSVGIQYLSKTLGRVQTNLMTRLVDIILLITMACITPSTTNTKIKAALVTVHLLRTAFANCARPLVRSVLMEHVAKKHRGRVNAVDSVRSFSWSGSAALGGWLIEKYGYKSTFLMTAGIKMLAFLPLCPLILVVTDGVFVNKKRRGRDALRRRKLVSTAMEEDGNALIEPLLSVNRTTIRV